MNKQLVLTLILILFLFFCLFLPNISSNTNQEHFITSDEKIPHNKDTCTWLGDPEDINPKIKEDEPGYISHYPFSPDSECDALYKSSDINPHVNIEDPNVQFNIHFVDPKSPCCLRTCINDFTKTEENSTEGDTSNMGNFRDFEGNDMLKYLYLSQCDKCISNFTNAIELLNTGKKCPKK